MPELAWRPLLADSLSRILKRPIGEEQAEDTLLTLPGKRLLALDDALRRKGWWHSHGDRSSVRLGGGMHPVGLLFVAACEGNGYLRQSALEAFRRVPGRLALAIALIRCDDWVAEVRSAALHLLRVVLLSGPDCSPLTCLDLLWTLSRRLRFHAEAWGPLIEPWLSVPEGRELRWQWVFKGSWPVSRWAAELVLWWDPDRKVDLVLATIAGGSLPLALWGLEHLPELPAEVFGAGLQHALTHPAAAVRAAGVRLTTRLDSGVARTIVETLLFDPARSPRMAAAHLLEQRFGTSPQALWRARSPSEPGVASRAALLGLCEQPEPVDLPRLEAACRDASAMIRVAGLRGLGRVQGANLSVWLVCALEDPSRMVVRQALQLYRRGNEALDAVTLHRAILKAHECTLRALLSGVRQLEKWESLELLVTLAAEKPELTPAVIEESRRWRAAANDRFTTAPAALLARLGERSTNSQWWRLTRSGAKLRSS